MDSLYHIPKCGNWHQQLIDFAIKYLPAPTCPPEIKFPFLAVFYRKKISRRNNTYLVAVAIQNYGDIVSLQRNLKHKGWPTLAMTFILIDYFLPDFKLNRYLFHNFQNWDNFTTATTKE